MIILQFLFFGLATACTTRGRANNVNMSSQPNQPPIESGSVDIPIRLQFQQSPIPSASVSIGIESKMNQHIGNGVYKQTQFNGGFEVQGAAVPKFDADHKVQGITADLDTRVSHDNKVVFLDHNPMLPTVKPVEQFTAGRPVEPVYREDESVVIVPAPQQQQQQQRQQQAFVKQQQDDDMPVATSPSKHIAGLKLEYFIAIMGVSSCCLIVLVTLMIVIAKKKQRTVEQVEISHEHHHHRHHSGSSSVYSSPLTIVDQKPPSYSSEMKHESTEADFDKKY